MLKLVPHYYYASYAYFLNLGHPFLKSRYIIAAAMRTSSAVVQHLIDRASAYVAAREGNRNTVTSVCYAVGHQGLTN